MHEFFLFADTPSSKAVRYIARTPLFAKRLVFSFVCFLLITGTATPKQHQDKDQHAIDQEISRARSLRENGNFARASALLGQVIERARQSGYRSGEAHALLAQSACQISLFEYRSALNLLNRAEALGTALGDATIQGASALNKATAYAELGDFALGLQQAHRATVFFARTSHKDYIAKSLLVYANLQASRGDIDDALAYYAQVVSICQDVGLPEIEASAWEDEGESLLDANRLALAEKSLRRAYSIRTRQNSMSSLAVTVCNLAELKLKQGHLKSSLDLLNQIAGLPTTVLAEIPPYELLETRGEIFAALGRNQAALSEMYKAVLAADRVRASTLPATRLNTIVHLHTVYQNYVTLAAKLAVDRHDNSLARKSLGILARSRAAAYRDEIETNLDRQGQLPYEYLQLLAQLRQAQAKDLLGYGTATSDNSVDRLRLRLADMENELSLRSASRSVSLKEKSPERVVTEIQAHLGPKELLLSITLGSENSYLWATTSQKVRLYSLPKRSIIEAKAKSFAQAVRTGKKFALIGRAFREDLLGPLSSDLLKQPDWLLDADGELLDGIPFSALPVQASGQDSVEYLIDKHSLRLLPSGDLLAPLQDQIKNPDFLGVGDAIYNTADPRWKASGNGRISPMTGPTLARLVGSRRELDVSVRNLRPSNAGLLLGSEATIQNLNERLLRRPNIIHFAVHVISPPHRPQQAALALSLSKKGIPDLITPETVKSFQVPGSLVVLSGCASQQGEVLPLVGVIGLSRSWLIAGADAVVVSAWPTPDTGGVFFSKFYRYFRDHTDSADSVAKRAARALQLAQSDLAGEIGSNSNAAIWPAYSVISTD